MRGTLQRRLELDAARGLMLVWITLTHLPTNVSTYVNQPLGFFSAAEGFIFLSALFTGRIYFRIADRDGFRAMYRKISFRTVRLYGYHLALLALTFLIAVPIAQSGNRPGLHNLLDYYFNAGPVRAIVNGAALLYRPPLLDILPMYIIFLLVTPMVLIVGRKYGWKYILATSFVLWALAQFGLRQHAHDFFGHFGLTIPLNEMGSFDLWAWQLLWMLGVWFGIRWAKEDLALGEWARKLTIPAALLVPSFLILRYMVGAGFELGNLAFNVDKWHLGVVRLVDFGAVAVLLIRFQDLVKPLAIRPLVMMGQSSLQVFCAHLFFCFFGLTIMGNASMVSGWRQVMLLAITFSAMLFTARMFSKSDPSEALARAARPKISPNRRVLSS